MLVFRSVVVGLLGAACLLLATRPQHALILSGPPPAIVVMPNGNPEPASAASPVTVIDVAPGVTGELLASLIVLAANEHIIAIDDRPVSDARAALGALSLPPRAYVDVSIASDVGANRRVLVLAR